MPATTFQQILSQFLEEKSPFPIGETAAKPELKREFTSYEPIFTWEAPPARPAKKSAYPKTTPRFVNAKTQVAEEKSPAPEAKTVPTPSEATWEITKLAPEMQLQVAILTRMGAKLEGKISISLLKKAHRTLAKKLHPDFQGQNLPANLAQDRAEKFLELQSIYEGLLKSLKALA